MSTAPLPLPGGIGWQADHDTDGGYVSDDRIPHADAASACERLRAEGWVASWAPDMTCRRLAWVYAVQASKPRPRDEAAHYRCEG